jgi:hypothetical protein
MSDATPYTRDELATDVFEQLFNGRYGEQICRNCWRINLTEPNYPAVWEQQHKNTETAKALAGTRDRVHDYTTRDHDEIWCECGSSVRDRFDPDFSNDIAVENFEPETNRSNWLLDVIAAGHDIDHPEVDAANYNDLETHDDRQEYVNALADVGVDFDAYEEHGDHVNLRALDLANHIGRNFCMTAAWLRWSDAESGIPDFSTGSFIGSMLDVLRSGETTKIRTALRYAFADAVISFRTARGTENLNLVEEARWIASRPSEPPQTTTDIETDGGGPASQYPRDNYW